MFSAVDTKLPGNALDVVLTTSPLLKMPLDSEMKDIYASSSTAQTYKAATFNVTSKVSERCLALLPPITVNSVVHDNACGPGIVTSDILATCAEKQVSLLPRIYATDYFQSTVDVVHELIANVGLEERVTAQVMDGSNLAGFQDSMFTHSITNLGIFAFPDPPAGMREIYRTLQASGSACVTTWKKTGNLEFANRVAQTIDPGLEAWWPVAKQWYTAEKLIELFIEGGFRKEAIELSEVTVTFDVVTSSKRWRCTAISSSRL